MNDITNDRVGPMQNPPHLGELIRESMDDVGWNVTEDGGVARLRARNAVSPPERQGGSVRKHGVGAGGHRLGDRRALDADAGRATSLLARAGTGSPHNDAPKHCAHDQVGIAGDGTVVALRSDGADRLRRPRPARIATGALGACHESGRRSRTLIPKRAMIGGRSGPPGQPSAASLAAFEPSLHFVDFVHALDDDAAGRGRYFVLEGAEASADVDAPFGGTMI